MSAEIPNLSSSDHRLVNRTVAVAIGTVKAEARVTRDLSLGTGEHIKRVAQITGQLLISALRDGDFEALVGKGNQIDRPVVMEEVISEIARSAYRENQQKEQ